MTITKKITGQIVHVSRRRFLSGTAGAIAATGAALLPQQAIAADETLTLEQMAHALHADLHLAADCYVSVAALGFLVYA